MSWPQRVNDLLAGRAMFALMLLASAAMAAVTVQCMAALAQLPHLVPC